MNNKRLILASEFDLVADRIAALEVMRSRSSVLFIPTASYYKDWQSYFEQKVRPVFEKMSILADVFDLTGATKETVAQKLSGFDIVYVGGGNTFYLLEKMKACDFSSALNDFFNRGGLYIGSSAGAVVCAHDIGYIAPMDDPSAANLQDYKGLCLVDRPVVPHTDSKDCAKICADILSSLEAHHILAAPLSDHEFLVIDHNKTERSMA